MRGCIKGLRERPDEEEPKRLVGQHGGRNLLRRLALPFVMSDDRPGAAPSGKLISDDVGGSHER